MRSVVFELRVDYDGGFNSEYSEGLYRSRARAEERGRKLAAELYQPNKHYNWMPLKSRNKWQKKMIGGWRVVEREVN